MLPPFLKAGDTVSIVSPSGAIDPEYIDGAAAVLESWGLKVKIMPHAKGDQGCALFKRRIRTCADS